MPTFIYKAKEKPGKVVVGEIEAEDANGAASKIKQKGLFPFFINKKEEDFLHRSASHLIFKNISFQEINIFIRQLSNLIHSGLSLAKSLNSLKQQTANKDLRAIVEDVEIQIRKGESFHKALSKHPKTFSLFFINIVRAGEAGGLLDEALRRLSETREREQDLKNQIKAALAYPILLVIVSLLVVFVLLTFIIPRFVEMFEDLGQLLPLPTRILLGISNFFNSFWPLFLIALVLVILTYRRYTSSYKGAFFLNSLKLKLPLLGNIVRQMEISHFARIFGTLLKNGIPILEALKVTSQTMANKVFSKETERYCQEVEKGRKLSNLMKESNIFPPSVSDLVAVGEESAGLEQILIDISDSFEKESQARIKTFMSILEPLLILILGAMVALIVISMLLPIFEIDILLR